MENDSSKVFILINGHLIPIDEMDDAREEQ